MVQPQRESSSGISSEAETVSAAPIQTTTTIQQSTPARELQPQNSGSASHACQPADLHPMSQMGTLCPRMPRGNRMQQLWTTGTNHEVLWAGKLLNSREAHSSDPGRNPKTYHNLRDWTKTRTTRQWKRTGKSSDGPIELCTVTSGMTNNTIPVTVGKTVTWCLIDTGAHISCVSKQFLNSTKLSEVRRLEPSDIPQVRLADGKVVNLYEKVQIPI